MALPVHSTFDCVCCADMGIKVRQLAVQAQAEIKARVSTEGMEQFFQDGTSVEEAVIAEVVEVIEQVTVRAEDSQYETLLKLVNEQAQKLDEQQAKLEAASFRIGYLEGQLENDGKSRRPKLLRDYRASEPLWNKLVSAVKATFAWPPTPEELSDIK